MVYHGCMSKNANRRNRKSTETRFPTAVKARWMPNDNTRAVTFADRRKVADKRACRGKVAWD